MEAVRTFLFFLLLRPSVLSLELTGPSVHATMLGSDARIPCWFTVDEPPVDPNQLTITWDFLNKEILSYNKTMRTTSPRYSLTTEASRTGVANLTISNIQIPDGGMYKCSVIYSSERKEKEVRLDIGAPPQVTITDKMAVVNVESVLRCSVTGFYPVDIDIRWFKDTERLSDVIVDQPQRNQDGLYNVNSAVTITPTEEDRERIFSCRVQHDFLRGHLQRDFHLEYGDGSSAGIIAACSVSVVLLIIIIAAVLWWKLKSRRKDIGPFAVGDIAGSPTLIDGEEATLCCTVDNARKKLCVTWLIRKDGQEQEIQTSQMREHSEEERKSLLDTSYVIKSQQEGRQYLSSLIFIPHIERHKDVTFICRGVSGKRKDEKTFLCKRIYGKPQMSAPIEITMADSSRVQFSLNLQKFYPKDINISWYKEPSGKYGLSHQEIINTKDSDVTYEVTSVVQIPDYTFGVHPEMKIIVEWEHESMETPERRSLSVRDFPWHPDVRSINVPELEDGKSATLTCNISGYFPDLLSIIWFTKKDGNVTDLPREPSKKDRNYKISHKGKRQTDNTYSCEASVTFIPIISLDQGSEIICRVEHPSEEGPIERSTGPLHIDVRKQRFVQNTKQLFESGKQYIGSFSNPRDSIFSSNNKDKKPEKGEATTETTGTGEATESKGANCHRLSRRNQNPD
ncbi:uncharacterized protein [Phyllobates terribilis]|uniref:uncharacterized protein n=1 Tax=Phyllobates terribilis TaxID=111132 RepID=UPI003CCAA1EE